MKLYPWEVKCLRRALKREAKYRWIYCPFASFNVMQALGRKFRRQRHHRDLDRHCVVVCGGMFLKIMEPKVMVGRRIPPCPASCSQRTYANQTITKRVKKELEKYNDKGQKKENQS